MESDVPHGDDAAWTDSDPSGAYRPPPPPDDRVWRHPSEVDVVAPGDLLTPAALGLAGRRSTAANVGVVVLASVVGALLTWGLVAATGGLGDRVVEVVEREAVSPVAVDAGGLSGVVGIAEAVRPAITRIEVQGMGQSGSGSGVLFRDNGYLLTNHHVVTGADRVLVVLSDGREVEGEVVGGDPETDVAVVKIPGGPYPVAVLGTATQIRVGEPAIAIGSPLGLRGGPSVTVGVISALGRRVENASGPALLDMIQTDAPIAPGSSGGALLDSRGAVVGITTAIAVSDVGAEGLGFATPIDVARSVADDLIATGEIQRVWLGVEGIDVAASEAAELGISGGAEIRRIVPDSPAETGGLAVADVVVGIDDRLIDSMSQLVVVLRTYEPGDRARLDVLRGTERVTVEVELAERPDSF